MDDLRFGASMRAARVRRRWRQSDVAKAAGVSASQVSRLERGFVVEMQLRAIRAIAAVLGVSVVLAPKSRSGGLERVANAAHATLAEQALRWISGFSGWVVRPEISFSRYGERGIIDLLAWHVATRSLLVIELKTEVVDIGELLGTLDRKARNAAAVAAELGWLPASVSVLLLIGDSDRNRDRVAAHAATFEAALPLRIARLRSWLRGPQGPVRALAFFANRLPGAANPRVTAVHRVRRPASGPAAGPNGGSGQIRA